METWENISFGEADKDADFSSVLTHLVNFFSKDENTLSLFSSGHQEEVKSDLNWILKIIFQQGFCYIAKDVQSSEIIGVLCTYVQPKTQETLPFDSLQSWPMQVVFGLTTIAVQNSCIWENIDADEYLHVFALSTHPKWRHRGLGSEIARRAYAIQKAAGRRYVMSLFTSPYSKKIAENLGFQLLEKSKVFYDTLTHEGKLIFPSGAEGKTAELLLLDLTRL